MGWDVGGAGRGVCGGRRMRHGAAQRSAQRTALDAADRESLAQRSLCWLADSGVRMLMLGNVAASDAPR